MVDWFKRHGIPGGIFYCAIILWGCVFWENGLPKADSINKIGIVAFLPLGYGLAIIGRMFYHLRKNGVHKMGVDLFSRFNGVIPQGFLLNSSVDLSENELTIWSPFLGGICSSIERDSIFNKPLNLEAEASGWVRRRMDILEMNDLIRINFVIAPFVSIFSVLLIPKILGGIKGDIFTNINFYILFLISLVGFSFCTMIKSILEKNISILFAAVLKYRHDIIRRISSQAATPTTQPAVPAQVATPTTQSAAPPFVIDHYLVFNNRCDSCFLKRGFVFVFNIIVCLIILGLLCYGVFVKNYDFITKEHSWISLVIFIIIFVVYLFIFIRSMFK